MRNKKLLSPLFSSLKLLKKKKGTIQQSMRALLFSEQECGPGRTTDTEMMKRYYPKRIVQEQRKYLGNRVNNSQEYHGQPRHEASELSPKYLW
ncbi:hypothetical protein C5167_016239 [Papaver somniferum]|nr:hypothetical protein C5167_016239 [Papaver somniferum]